jgi:molybdopterin converting factor small subunit
MHVEFFGVPRERAGLSVLEMNAETLGQLLTTLAARIPSFDKFISTDGQGSHLHPAFIANLNGDRFVSDPRTPLAENDCVMILSADAGG